MNEFNFFLPLTKVEKNKDGSVTVSGYASTPALDLDGEIVSLDAIKAALPGYWEWRNIREMHQPSAVGVGQEASVDAKGLFLRSKITDREAAKKCLDGVYKGYSIGGRKLAKTGNTITEIDLIEISVVDRPANPECKIEVAKRAGIAAPAHLVKFRTPMTPQSRALKKMAQAVESLAKEGPPAAQDGFSLPAPKAVATPNLCKKHGVADCAKCAAKVAKREAKIKKREFSSAQRQSAAQSGAALPDGSFPIKNKDDLGNARQAVGRAKNPGKARAHIRTRAAALGVKLPDKWTKKEARALISAAEKSAGRLDLTKSLRRTPSFLTLSAEQGPALEGDVLDLGHGSGLGELGGLSQEDDLGFLDLGKTSTLEKELTMADQNSELAKAIRRAVKASRVSPTARIIGQARGNLKKARKAASDMEECVKAAHGLLKSAYLSKDAMVKAGKKPKDDGDADDLDMMGKVMGELNKAFGSAQTMKTFIKAANGQLKKAAGRSGQRGQEVSDGEGGFYEVPKGVRDLSIGDLAGAAPGTAGGGSQPPMYPADGGVYPGKAARKAGMISSTEAEALIRAATAEAKVEVLEKLPATTGGRRPYAFDVTKAFGGEQGGQGDSGIKTLLDGVDTKAIGSGDELAHTSATAKMFGNMVLNGHGRSIMSDPEFRGGAGKRAGN